MKPPRKDPVLAAVTDGWSTTPEVARRATAHERDRRQALLDRELKHLKVRVWSSVTIGLSAVAVILFVLAGMAS